MSANRYNRFVELSNGFFKDSRIPLYSSKSSKKTYTQHQLLILLLLKEYLSEDYRDTIELSEIRDSLNSCSLIPVRNKKRKPISGYCRKRIAQSFDPERYHQRNKVETVFSVMKRKFGESLKARKYRLQINEIKIKVIL